MKIPLTAIRDFKQLWLMPSILDTGHECVAEDCCTKSLAEWNFEIELNVKMESQHKYSYYHSGRTGWNCGNILQKENRTFCYGYNA